MRTKTGSVPLKGGRVETHPPLFSFVCLSNKLFPCCRPNVSVIGFNASGRSTRIQFLCDHLIRSQQASADYDYLILALLVGAFSIFTCDGLGR